MGQKSPDSTTVQSRFDHRRHKTIASMWPFSVARQWTSKATQKKTIEEVHEETWNWFCLAAWHFDSNFHFENVPDRTERGRGVARKWTVCVLYCNRKKLNAFKNRLYRWTQPLQRCSYVSSFIFRHNQSLAYWVLIPIRCSVYDFEFYDLVDTVFWKLFACWQCKKDMINKKVIIWLWHSWNNYNKDNTVIVVILIQTWPVTNN